MLFPRQNPGHAVMEALLMGRLVEEAGCLYIAIDEKPLMYVPVWPSDYSLRSNSGMLEILDGSSDVRVQVGEQVFLSGGHVESLDHQDAVSSDMRAQVQARCPGMYWLVGSEVRPAS